MDGPTRVVLVVAKMFLYLRVFSNVEMVMLIQLLLRGFFRENFIFQFFNIYFQICFEGFYIEIPRYKLDIEVTHQEQRSVFVFSDSLCAHFFGISAFELKKSLLVVCYIFGYHNFVKYNLSCN
jgi:hypothetical protein